MSIIQNLRKYLKIRFRKILISKENKHYTITHPSVSYSATYRMGYPQSNRQYYVEYCVNSYNVLERRINWEMGEFLRDSNYWDDFWLKLHGDELEADLVKVAINNWSNKEPFLFNIDDINFGDPVKKYAFFKNSLNDEMRKTFNHIELVLKYAIFQYLNVCQYDYYIKVMEILENDPINLSYDELAELYVSVNESEILTAPRDLVNI